MSPKFTSLVSPPSEQREPAYWFIFNGYRLLVQVKDDKVEIPSLVDISELGLTAVRQQYLGYLEAKGIINCYSAEVVEETEAPKDMVFQGLRTLFSQLGNELTWLAGRAIQIMDWDRTHQFCSRCGERTQTMPNERAKKCPKCGFTSYPRLSPAIIVRVTRKGEKGSEILLARARHFRPGFYSVLAGFVEPGETLEDCVRREVKEEVGIDIKNIRYFGSQPWPFPNSLMLGFTAEYAGGDIILEEEEMEDAGWYTVDALPNIPPPISISRRLIDNFIDKHKQ